MQIKNVLIICVKSSTWVLQTQGALEAEEDNTKECVERASKCVRSLAGGREAKCIFGLLELEGVVDYC